MPYKFRKMGTVNKDVYTVLKTLSLFRKDEQIVTFCKGGEKPKNVIKTPLILFLSFL